MSRLLHWDNEDSLAPGPCLPDAAMIEWIVAITVVKQKLLVFIYSSQDETLAIMNSLRELCWSPRSVDDSLKKTFGV